MFVAFKKVIGKLNKCYSIAPLRYKGKDHILVAAEKCDPCIMFDAEGAEEETVWTEPGGVMTMVQVPGSDGVFLATHKFYSPNDSKEAKIVVATSTDNGWKIKTLTDLPFVHRFDILERNGVRYLIACALKSGHEYKDDWSSPGKVYAAVLPDDLSPYNDDNQLPLTVIKDGLLKNHGYYRKMDNGVMTALISCENGVFQFVPPESPDGEWEIKELSNAPSSDAVLVDLDGDGVDELTAISHFHGDALIVYKYINNEYTPVYTYDHAEFAHAIYGGDLCGVPAVVIGHRKGDRDLLAFYWDKDDEAFKYDVLDHDVGPANIYHYVLDGEDIIISANRETDEIARYVIRRV